MWLEFAKNEKLLPEILFFEIQIRCANNCSKVKDIEI